MSSTSTITWALQAANWAKKPNPAHPECSNFEVFLDRLERESRRPHRITIMRNQASMGMSNNYWPTMSRLAIMAIPTLALYINPRHVRELDGDDGRDLLNMLYTEITDQEPAIHDWKAAKQRQVS